MNLKKRLESSYLEKGDIQILTKIYRNISSNYFPCNIPEKVIDKIIDSYDINKILLKMKDEYIDDSKIIKYFFNSLDKKEKIIVEEKFIDYAILFPNYEIDWEVKIQILNYYKNIYTLYYDNKEKKKIKIYPYSHFLYFISLLINKDCELRNLEKYEKDSGENLSWVTNYILKAHKDNKISALSKKVEISNEYLDFLRDDNFLLKTIIDIYNIYFKDIFIYDYINHLKLIFTLQGAPDKWINLNKIGNLIDLNLRNLMIKTGLIEEYKEENYNLLKLSYIGYSIAQNKFLDEWEDSDYYIKSEKITIIPHNYNPSIIFNELISTHNIINILDYLIVILNSN